MNAQVKERWLAALRSGKYKQTKGALNRGDNHYCCLGVLCELAIEEGVVLGWVDTVGKTLDKSLGIISVVGGDVESAILPKAVVEWAGLPESNPTAGECLAEANDYGRDFNYIADLIERYL